MGLFRVWGFPFEGFYGVVLRVWGFPFEGFYLFFKGLGVPFLRVLWVF